MVVRKVENETSKTTTICGTSSGGKPKFKNEVRTTTPQKTCIRTTEYKSSHSKYCCSCNEKEVFLKTIILTFLYIHIML